MAIEQIRNFLMLLAGVDRAEYEPEPTEDQNTAIDETDTIVRFKWKPGDGQTYDLQYTIRQANTPAGVLVWRYSLIWYAEAWQLGSYDRTGNDAARAFEWCENSHLHGAYFADRLDIPNERADGLLLLLEALGHSVNYCDPSATTFEQYARDVCLASETDARPPTPVLVEDDEGVTNASR